MFGLETCREERGSSPSSALQDQGAQVCRQVWVAAGHCNWEMCYEETSYRWEILQFTARGGTTGFSSVFVVRCMGRIFCEKQRITGEPGPLAMEQGRQERDSGVFCSGKVLIQYRSSQKKIECPLYSLVIKMFVITTQFCLNSLDDFNVFQFLKGNFV